MPPKETQTRVRSLVVQEFVEQWMERVMVERFVSEMAIGEKRATEPAMGELEKEVVGVVKMLVVSKLVDSHKQPLFGGVKKVSPANQER